MKTDTAPTPIAVTEMSVIVFRPNDDKPGILSLRPDGTRLLSLFGNDAECTDFWTAIEERIRNESFVRYYNMFFRAEELKMLDRCASTDRAFYLHFIFHNGFEFWQTYTNEAVLNIDLSKINDILATLQDIRASRYPPETKQ